MFSRLFFLLVVCLIVIWPVKAPTATCLDGGCHSSLTNTRYVHGPIAAESLGVKGCVMCHEPAGKSCSNTQGGTFKPMRSSMQMCQVCHSKGHGSQHTAEDIDCLKCHDPHGSESSPQFNR